MSRNTGLRSSILFLTRSPRTGIPPVFQTPAEFDEFVRILVATNSIDNGKKIWWDLRPHPFFETIEFRVCDIPMRLDETVTMPRSSRRSARGSTSCGRRTSGSASTATR